MISKATFVEALTNIKKQDAKDDAFAKAIEDYACDSRVMIGTDNLYLESLLAVLKETMQDAFDMIEWWLWEDVPKLLYSQETGGVCNDLTTPEALYDYLVEDLKEDEGNGTGI